MTSGTNRRAYIFAEQAVQAGSEITRQISQRSESKTAAWPQVIALSENTLQSYEHNCKLVQQNGEIFYGHAVVVLQLLFSDGRGCRHTIRGGAEATRVYGAEVTMPYVILFLWCNLSSYCGFKSTKSFEAGDGVQATTVVTTAAQPNPPCPVVCAKKKARPPGQENLPLISNTGRSEAKPLLPSVPP